jgi:hypothetical protein
MSAFHGIEQGIPNTPLHDILPSSSNGFVSFVQSFLPLCLRPILAATEVMNNSFDGGGAPVVGIVDGGGS